MFTVLISTNELTLKLKFIDIWSKKLNKTKIKIKQLNCET